MKNKCLLIAILAVSLFINDINSFSQEWTWSQNLTSSLNVKVNNIKYYLPDDSYITYTDFEGEITVSGQTFTSRGYSDILVTKFSNDGNVSWIKQFGGPGEDVPKDMVIDDNNIILSGSVSDGAVFDGITINTYAGSEDVFLATLDPDGNVIWVKNVGWGDGVDRANCITKSDDGYIYVVGFFNDTLMFTSDTLVAQKATANPFISKFDDNGNYISSGQLIGTSKKNRFNGVSVANDGDIMLSGFFRDSVFLLNDTLVSNGYDDIIFAKISPVTFISRWIRIIGGTGYDRSYNSVTDSYSNYYLVGYISNTAYIDSSGQNIFDGTPLISNGGYDIVIVKYNQNGRLIWKKNIGDTGNDIGYKISLNQDLLSFTGYFSGILYFGNDTISSSSITNNDILIGALNTKGALLSALSAQGDAHDRGQAIAMQEDGSGLIGGYFESTTLTIGNDSYSNGGGRDGFIAKYLIPFKIALTSQQNVSCNGGSDGSATVTPYFGTYPYTYLWSYDDGTADSTLTNVPAGDYWVKVTDANNKTDSVTFTITEPNPIHVNADITDVSCSDKDDGAIDITVSGGTAPYTYLWSTSNGSGLDQTQEDQTGLTAGDYTVRITDDHSCTKDTTIIVNEPDPITFGGSSVTNIERPPGGNGAIDLVVNGGTPDYTYYWEGPNGFSATTQDLSGLDDGGDYKVTVTDHNSCQNDTTFLVEDKDALIANIDSVKDVTCYGGSDGYAHVAVTGGSGNYEYYWTNAGGTHVGGNSPSLPNVPAGTYYVQVTDQLDSRTSSTSATISQPAQALNIALSAVEDISCNGLDDGKIDITITGGWLPYTFSWTGPGGFTANTEDIANLAPGYYNVIVTDKNGCTEQISSIEIKEPDALVVTIQTNQEILCNGDLTGELEAMPNGGTGAYAYLWDDPGHQTTKKASYLEAGTYTVTVTDDNGCTAQGTETLTQPDALVVTAAITDVTCPGNADGSIILTVDGGSVPYNYLWTPGNETTKDLTDIGGGDYTVTLTDAHNCSWDSTFTVAEADAIVIDSVSVTEISGCSGNTNGALVIHASGGTKPFEYSVDGGTTFQTDSLFNNLGAGDYTIAVRDANSCDLTGSTYTLTDPPGIVIDDVVLTPITCPGTTGALVILASGGIRPYSYSIDGGTTYWSDSSFSDLPAGNYDIAVKDPNDCVTHGNTVALTAPDPITITSAEATPTCPGDKEGAVTVSATGGTGELMYVLLNDQHARLDSNHTGSFTGLDLGVYYVTVNDENHCGPVSSSSIEIIQGDNCALIIYNAFSPNGDGKNDEWHIRGIQSHPNCIVKVFNTWGKQVFSSKGYTEPWDGTFNGKELPAGTYYYIIELGPGEKTYSGSVNIVK